MKKVLSFVLVLSMILGSFGMAFAAPAADVVGKDCEDAVNVLTELGVIAGYKDGSFKPEKVVTRAEAATFIVKALGLADYAVEKSTFADMAGHWADPFVAYAASLEFVKGRTATTFDPDAVVTSDEMITMLVQALGYKADHMVGGYPGAFVNQAKTLGMLDGVKSGKAGCTRGDVAQLIFNTLAVDFVRYDNDGQLQLTVPNQQGALVQDNMITRLGGYADPNYFVVDGEEPSLIDLADYVGSYVKVFREDDANGDILAVSDVKSVFMTGKFTTDAAIGALTSGAVEFKADDVTYTVKAEAYDDAAQVAIGFRNGEEDTNVNAVTSDASFTLAVKVSGKKITDLYSVSVWDYAANHKMVDEDDLEAIVDDQKLLDKKFELDNNDEIDAVKFELLGVEALEDIEEDDVVYVYEGANYIRRVAVGTEVVEGKISKINSGNTKVTVNGKVYEAFDGAAYAAGTGNVTYLEGSTLAAGNEVKLYLDYFGDVYAVEVVSAEADTMAIVVDTAAHVAGLNGQSGKIQLFTEEGKVVTFEIDNDDLTATEFNTAIAGDVTAGAVIKYSVNEAGKLDDLAMATTTASIGPVKVTDKGYVNGLKLAEDALIFTADDVTTASAIVTPATDFEDELGIGSFKALLGKEGLSVIYHYDATAGEIDWIVVSGGTASEGVYAVYNGFSAVDNAGDDDYEIDLMVGGVAAAYTSEKTGTELASAASIKLYEVVLDSTGVLSGLTEVTNGYVSGVTVTSEAVASVAAVKNNVVTVSGGAVAYRALDADVLVYTWDVEDEVWAKGSVSDIKDTDFTTVQFYDVDGEDLAYDIVLVK